MSFLSRAASCILTDAGPPEGLKEVVSTGVEPSGELEACMRCSWKGKVLW